MPPFASKQDEYRMVSSVPRKSDMRSSSSRCTSWVPQMKRTEAMPYPQRSRARCAASITGGMRGEAEVVVGAEVQDLPAGRTRMRTPCGLPMTRSSLNVPAARISATRGCQPPARFLVKHRLHPPRSPGSPSRSLPDCMASNPLRNSSKGNRWVRTGETSSPLCSMVCILYQVSKISLP